MRDSTVHDQQWVLLIEDEEAHAELVRIAFEAANGDMRLVVATSLGEARAWLQQHTPEIILTDYRLPDGDGRDVLDLPGVGERFPVIIMTSFGDESVATRVMKAGALDYFTKSSAMLSDAPHIAERALREWHAILEHRRLEVQFQQTRRLESLGLLAGGLAHEFNNILGVILGYADLVQMSLPPASRQRRDLEEIAKAADRGRELVQRIMDASHQNVTHRTALALGGLLTENMRSIGAMLPACISIEEDLNVAGDIALVDAGQIRQLLMNLCINAYQAMQDTGGILRVSLAACELTPSATRPVPLPDGRYLRLTIRDTGPGVSPDIAVRIFDPFFTTRDVGEGEGLGLSIAHSIATGHGGAITLDSPLTGGAAFHVYLPAHENQAPAMVTDTRDEDRQAARILVVDDEAPLCQIADRMLTAGGHSVTTACDGDEALRLFRSDPNAFDVVITDYTMPGCTGLTMAQAMRGVRPDLAIVLVTGALDRDMTALAASQGITELLAKPYSRRQLNEAVRRALNAAAVASA